MLLWLPLWVTVAFIASNIIIAGLLLALDWLKVSPQDYLRPAVFQTLAACIIYAITIGIVISVPYGIKRYTTSLETLGLNRLPSWTDIGLAPVGFVGYALLIATVTALITSLLPGLPLDQVQDIGFKALGSQSDNMLAFVTLVVIAPIAEETLFRGYLYGKLKRYVPTYAAAIATSLLFAVAHFQLNVGIDVFVLSLILCGMRSLTGSIWAGVLVHMLKNMIAYYLLFVSPLLGG